VEGDHRGKPGARQVTVISHESWESVCSELGQAIPWTARRANLLVEQISLQSNIGKFLKIGEVWLKITGETQPCHRMDEYYSGLRLSLEPHWRGGVTCLVISEGTICEGDGIELRKTLG
jgi:MOSC domain-containing protein YiiM